MRKDSASRKIAGVSEIRERSNGYAPSANPRERIRPRKRRPKRSVWRRTVWPMLRFALMAMVVVLVLNKVYRPFGLYDRERSATADLQSQLDSLRSENTTLERRIKYLKTPEGAAQAARELGWVKPGEITLVMPPEKNNLDKHR